MIMTSPLRQLDVQGMTCASCAARIEKKLNRMDGVSATVNYATERATVQIGPGTTPKDLITTIQQTGYGANLCADAVPDVDHDIRSLRSRFLLSAVLSLPVITMAMVPALQFPWWQWISFALTLPVVGWCAWPFHRAALLNLRHGNATMDTLISIGTLAAAGWSAFALGFGAAGEIGFTHPFEFRLIRHAATTNIYLEAAVGITTFLLLGRYLEARAKRRSGAALRALLALTPTEVAVLRDGTERVIAASALRVGDQFIVHPGERIATDGRVISGQTAVDTSTVTGESLPVEIGPGDGVFGGCVNTHGRLVVTATRIGADTQLAQIARLVEAAQSGKAHVQRLADRISGIFVPVVIAIAAGTARVLARPGLGCLVRLHRCGVGVDHRVPLCPRLGHSNGPAGRHRPRCAAGHPDQGPGGAGIDLPTRHGDLGQDRHDHRGPDECRRGDARSRCQRTGRDLDRRSS